MLLEKIKFPVHITQKHSNIPTSITSVPIPLKLKFAIILLFSCLQNYRTDMPKHGAGENENNFFYNIRIAISAHASASAKA